MSLNGYVWQVLESHNCFLILVVQRSCCQIHSSPSPPTRPRMYNLLMSSKMKYTKGSWGFFFTVPVFGNRIFRIPLRTMMFFFMIISCGFSEANVLSSGVQVGAWERSVHPLPQALQWRRQDGPGWHEDQLSCVLLQGERIILVVPFRKGWNRRWL